MFRTNDNNPDRFLMWFIDSNATEKSTNSIAFYPKHVHRQHGKSDRKRFLKNKNILKTNSDLILQWNRPIELWMNFLYFMTPTATFLWYTMKGIVLWITAYNATLH